MVLTGFTVGTASTGRFAGGITKEMAESEEVGHFMMGILDPTDWTAVKWLAAPDDITMTLIFIKNFEIESSSVVSVVSQDFLWIQHHCSHFNLWPSTIQDHHRWFGSFGTLVTLNPSDCFSHTLGDCHYGSSAFTVENDCVGLHQCTIMVKFKTATLATLMITYPAVEIPQISWLLNEW